MGILGRATSRAVSRILTSSAGLRFMGTVKRIDTLDPVVALTFDDGPHPKFTPLLLDVLKKHTASATFFMIGKNAEEHPELVRRAAEAGHVIANHSWDHPMFPMVSGGDRRRQMRRCANALEPFGAKIFRPPGGHQTLASRFDALRLGYEVVTWDVMAGDWLDHEYDSVRILHSLRAQIRPGSIVLLHDGLWDPETDRVADRQPMIRAVDTLLEEYSSKDFQFLTLPDLFAHGQPIRKLSRWAPEPRALDR